jgi:outer membrane immunogenic protein
MKLLWIAGAALAAFSSTAFAADLGAPARQPLPSPQTFTWTGFYLGTHTGIATGWTSSKNVAPYGGFNAGAPLTYESNPASIFGGGQVGYNWQSGFWMLGLELDGGYLGLRENTRPAPDDLMEVKYGLYGTFTGRLGFASDRLLSYVKGGAAVAQVRNTVSDLDGTGAVNATDYSSVSGARWGWAIGSGFEYAILPTVSLKSEYLYMDFGKRSSTNLDGDQFQHKNRIQTFKIGLNYRWGGLAANY